MSTRVLVVYHSIKGPVQAAAIAIADGARSVEGAQVEVKPIEETAVEDILKVDGVAFGSIKYYGSISPPLAELFRELYGRREELKYKVGVAFTGSPNNYGGQDHVMQVLIYSMLDACGMIVAGNHSPIENFIGGFIASDPMDERSRSANLDLGRRLAEVAGRLRRG